ncbi:MAG: hypothetical protein RIG61_00915 [Deltaproteobacteria bacterium]
MRKPKNAEAPPLPEAGAMITKIIVDPITYPQVISLFLPRIPTLFSLQKSLSTSNPASLASDYAFEP